MKREFDADLRLRCQPARESTAGESRRPIEMSWNLDQTSHLVSKSTSSRLSQLARDLSAGGR